MKKIFFLMLLFFTTTAVVAQKSHKVRGFIYSSEDGEAVGYATVIIRGLQGEAQTQGSSTNIDGFFQINDVRAGDYALEVRTSDFTTLRDTIEVGKKEILTLRYELEKDEDVKEIEGISVVGQDQSKRRRVEISVNKLDQEALERLPSFGAENDIVSALSITPGVITTGDQGGQLYVRGGTPIQNKILLDGMTIYNPFHSIGFFSVFETELIKSADVYTGGYAANYGGRISSIMDIQYRDGDLKSHRGMVSASPFLGKIVLEGPIVRQKDKAASGVSYILSAKHSLLDYTSKTLYPHANDGDGMPFSFTDIYGKITVKNPEGSKFSVFGFGNNDAVNYDNIADLSWKSYGGGLNFSLVPQNNPMIIKGHLNGSMYDITFQEENGLAPRTSMIGGFDLGFDFTYFLKNHSELTYGINIAGFTTDFHTYNEVMRKIELANFNTELSGYVNYRLVAGRWVVNPGVRLQVYPSFSTVIPEPRLGLKFNASENFRLKTSGGYYSQNFMGASSDRDVVTLFDGFLSAPTNVQSNFTFPNGKEVDPKNGIQTAWHGIFGFEYDLTKNLSMNVEGYYKFYPKLSNINSNKLYEDIPEFHDVADVYKKDFIIESGYSYGVDVLLEYKLERLFLWGVYSYGNSDRWDGFRYYAPVYDRRHNVNLVASYAFLKDKSLEISLRWNFGSGLPFTPTSGYYQGEDFSDGLTTDYTTSNPNDLAMLMGEMNSARLPTYHRFDISVKKHFKFQNKNQLELRLGVTNTYNRDNIFYVNRVTNDKIYQLPILPSIGVNFKW